MSVALNAPAFDGVTTKELVQQLEAKKKSTIKLPTWYSHDGIYYPEKLQIEQTSSEITASYKARIPSGKSLLDLNGGLGVDSYFFSQKMDAVSHCEIDIELSEIATHNFKILNTENIKTYAQNGLDFLQESDLDFDWVYTDPSRRNEAKGKVFLLSDCLPDIPGNLYSIFQKTDNLMIKTSPLLDFSAGIKELKYVKEIHVVGVKNEVKELLWVLEKNYKDSISIKTVNFKKPSPDHFNFELLHEKKATVLYGLPSKYLYEPNAPILKSGAFKTISEQFQVKKLHEHSHLYTSETFLDFPGRKFKIESVVPFHKKNIIKLGIQKANITTRNFPDNVANLRKKLKIKDGGDVYLFFTKDIEENNIMIRCSKTS